MLFDLGWPELLLIGVVALVVIGPKDLPNALRIAGFWFRKARSLSREFQSSVEQMIRESELDEIRKDMKKATEFDLEKEFQNTVDPTGELAESIKPPDIPDYFDEASTPVAAALPAPDPEPELPFLSPAETVGSASVAESGPLPAPVSSPEPSAGASETATAHEPAPSRP
jgi:sec-independent protein translocase protein TatB